MHLKQAIVAMDEIWKNWERLRLRRTFLTIQGMMGNNKLSAGKLLSHASSQVSFRSKKKLLFVVNDIGYLISHRLALVEEARALGHEVYIASPQGEAADILGSDRFHHIRIPLSRWGMNPFSDLYCLFSLIRIYINLKPDLVHHISIKPVVYGTIAARLTSVPAIVNSISGLGYMFSGEGRSASFRKWLATTLYRLSLRGSSSINICHNPDNLKFFEKVVGIDKSQLRILLGSGVDLSSFRPQSEPSGPITILLAARLLTEKGIREFAEAATLLQSQDFAPRFILIGQTFPAKPGAISDIEIQRWKKEGILEYHGFQSNVRHWIEQSHIVCLPSYQEGMPKILLEAAACGKAIVASKIPSICHIFKNGQNAVLIPPKDTSRLAAALKLLSEDSELREYLGANARKTVEERGCSLESIVSQTLGIYGYLLGIESGKARKQVNL